MFNHAKAQEQIISDSHGHTHTYDQETGIHTETYKFKAENGKKIPVTEHHDGKIERHSTAFKKTTDEHFALMELLIKKHSLAALIYNFFVKNMDNTNAIIMSFDAMEEYFGYSRSALSRAIKVLVSNKMLEIQKSGNMNVYCINADLVWAQREDKKKFARFNATVIISGSEQQTKKVYSKEIKTKKGNK